MSKSNWTVSVPVYNLKIEEDIGGEITVERVAFVSSKKIRRIRRRLGLPFTLSELESRYGKRHRPFEKAETYAFLRAKRSEDDDLAREYNRIREAIWLLASSQFARGKRTYVERFGFPEDSTAMADEVSLFDTDNRTGRTWLPRRSPTQPYVLNRQWKRFVSHHFFPDLLRILSGRKRTKRKWAFEIRKAAILSGKSWFSRDLAEAFLYNMIALETLLAVRGDRFPDSLIDRLNALFGWMVGENKQAWKIGVERIYDLRCKFVHTGNTGDITVEDLLQTDIILYNVLRNICRCPKGLSSREDICGLAKEIAARRYLGLKIRRPRLSFTYKHYDDQDVARLKKTNMW